MIIFIPWYKTQYKRRSKMKQPLITSIQKYSIHDGEGIRTTVFFKGCPLSCTWCHNPETQSFSKQLLFQADKCSACASCVQSCPNQAISIQNKIAHTDPLKCNQCGICEDYCIQNIREIAGKSIAVSELVRELEKDKAFYEQSHGGITLSGGEVMALDMDYLLTLLSQLKEKGYRVNIDTCGNVAFERFEKVLPYVDTFLYDVKWMDDRLHKLITGVSNVLILQNLMQLQKSGATIWIRVPIIEGVGQNEENIKAMAVFFKKEKMSPKQINLLPYHNTGSGKYAKLNWQYQGDKFKTPTQESLQNLADILKADGFIQVKIGG